MKFGFRYEIRYYEGRKRIATEFHRCALTVIIELLFWKQSDEIKIKMYK